MEIRILTGELAKAEADGLIVPILEGTPRLEGDIAAIDRDLDGAVSRLVETGDVKGKPDEVTVLHSLGKIPATWVAIIGMGKLQDVTKDRVRRAVAIAGRALRQRKAKNIATSAPGFSGVTPEEAAQAITEGSLLGLYAFRKHITKEPDFTKIKQLTVLDADTARLPVIARGYEKGRVLAEATNLARDMVNEPGNYMTPTRMAEVATELARDYRLEVNVLEREQMRELGMGALLGVSQGSAQPPKLIVLSYKGSDSGQLDIALVGKAITFDSGGISLKSAEGMGDMKGDMAGGAAVIAAMGGIARFKPKVNVVGIVPATENMPSGTAQRPGDIVTAMNGKTIEIISTDAEGRLTLADALSYANKLNAKAIIDVATLTGACRIALGDVTSGVFGNNQEWIDRVLAAATAAGERLWQMPMFDEYKEQIKSDVADMKNTGGRFGGAITAAQFLAEFAGETPWVHIDIAGPGMLEKERGYLVKGGTGVSVRTLVSLVLAVDKT
ncbi:MAG: leucyl aminopeptidase [Chloroflexi bacterium]|nr:leucyl aminopeptidase [Chloroflexota bacterium]